MTEQAADRTAPNITREEIEVLLKLAEAATPGPWKKGISGNSRVYGPDNAGGYSGLVAHFARWQDRDFIAAANPAAVSLHVSVRDTGIGIPAEKQQAIFEAFTQADSTTTRQYGGTGLGLTISAKLVALMGGQLWVNSESGRGSEFQFTAQLAALPVQPQLPEENFAGLSVLVVDDNATNRRILEGTLKQWGITPNVYASGAEALQALAKDQPTFAAALLDYRMPDMDGLQLATELKRQPALQGALMIMLSSSDQGAVASRCRELGVTACLTKPVRQSELRSLIRNALSQLHPLAAQPFAMPSLRAARKSGLTPKLQILLAEDNVVNQRLAMRLLEKQGHTVVLAQNGHEALEAAANHQFDLVLMDVQMPGMNGLEATACLRTHEQQTGGHLPVIAMTAHAMKGDRELCLAAGMDAYVSKPIQPAELFKTIAEVIAKTAPANQWETVAPLR